LLNKLKPVVANVDTTPSFKYPDITFFMISDTNLRGPSGQIPDLSFVGLDSVSGRRVFRE